MVERSDDELLIAARASPDAFAEFYRRHARPLTGFFLRRGMTADVAADLVAETFAAALAGVRRFDPASGPAAAWLYGIARRQLSGFVARGAVEQRWRRRLGMERLELSDEALERVEATLLSAGEADLVRTLVADLPPDQRTAVEARVVAGDSYAEIAATHDVTEAVARKRVSRGLSALRTRLLARRT